MVLAFIKPISYMCDHTVSCVQHRTTDDLFWILIQEERGLMKPRLLESNAILDVTVVCLFVYVCACVCVCVCLCVVVCMCVCIVGSQPHSAGVNSTNKYIVFPITGCCVHSTCDIVGSGGLKVSEASSQPEGCWFNPCRIILGGGGEKAALDPPLRCPWPQLLQ